MPYLQMQPSVLALSLVSFCSSFYTVPTFQYPHWAVSTNVRRINRLFYLWIFDVKHSGPRVPNFVFALWSKVSVSQFTSYDDSMRRLNNPVSSWLEDLDSTPSLTSYLFLEHFNDFVMWISSIITHNLKIVGFEILFTEIHITIFDACIWSQYNHLDIWTVLYVPLNDLISVVCF